MLIAAEADCQCPWQSGQSDQSVQGVASVHTRHPSLNVSNLHDLTHSLSLQKKIIRILQYICHALKDVFTNFIKPRIAVE